MAAEDPDLILLDVHLPDINGFEVCRRLKQDPVTAHIPVLQRSQSHVDDAARVHGLESGADAYLAEPVDRRCWSRPPARCCACAAPRPAAPGDRPRGDGQPGLRRARQLLTRDAVAAAVALHAVDRARCSGGGAPLRRAGADPAGRRRRAAGARGGVAHTGVRGARGRPARRLRARARRARAWSSTAPAGPRVAAGTRRPGRAGARARRPLRAPARHRHHAAGRPAASASCRRSRAPRSPPATTPAPRRWTSAATSTTSSPASEDWVMVIGDVCGRGAEAATLTASPATRSAPRPSTSSARARSWRAARSDRRRVGRRSRASSPPAAS